ncbi:MAG: O-antigen ligase family protein [Limisphaerales bacterium]
MDREQLDTWVERGILGLVVTALAAAPLATGAVRGQDFALVQTPLFLAVVLWVIRLWLNPSHRLQIPPAFWAVVAFAIYAVVRYFDAAVEYPARQEVYRIVTYVWLFVLVLNNLHRQETTQWLLAALLTVGTFISFYALYQYVTGSDRVWSFIRPSDYAGRGSGTYICPNHVAGLFEMLIPIALAGVLISKAKAVGRVFYGYAALAMFGGLAATVSRGAYLAAGVALLAMLLFLLRYRRSRIPAIIALVIVALAASAFFVQTTRAKKRFQSMVAPVYSDSSIARLHLWRPAIAMWKDHVWFGVGPAHYDVRFPQYRPTQVQSRPTWAHNDYVNTLADWGSVGAGLVAAFFLCVGYGAARTWRFVQRSEDGLSSRGSDRAAVVLGVATGVTALMVHSFVDFNWHIPANAMVGVALLAIITGHLRFTTTRYWVNPRLGGRLLITMLAAGTLYFLVPGAIRLHREGTAMTRFEKTRHHQQRMDAIHAAWTADPRNPETPQRIGEIYRLASWEGLDNWRELAEEALRWFDIAIRLNPFDAVSHYRKGMCLDWLGRSDEATVSFDESVRLDPNNHYVALMRAWHEMQRRDWVQARKWTERSLAILPWANYTAERLLAEIKRKPAAPPSPTP